MNKTVTVNIGGIVFHIDENAYERFKAYLESIRIHFSTAEGRDEIIQDIESRIAEMFQERITEGKQVITLNDVDEVTNVMGRPEQFFDESEKKTESEKSSATDESTFTTPTQKRLYRNPDEKIFGGVCSGIAAYFDIDPVWVRLLFAFVFFVFGSGFILYIVLWIIIPQAESSVEKLKMRGEVVNINNIERNVQEGSKDKKVPTSSRVFEGLASLVKYFFLFIGKVVAIFFLFIGLVMVLALSFSMLAVFNIPGTHFPEFIKHIFPNQFNFGLAFICAVLLVAIPFFMLAYAGARMLFNIKKTSKIVGFTALGLWLVCLAIAAFLGIKVAAEFGDSSSIRQNLPMNQPTSKYLRLEKIGEKESSGNKYYDRWDKDEWEGDYFLVQREGHIQASDVHLDIVKSPTDSFEIVQILYSHGSSKKDAAENATHISYSLSQIDSVLKFNRYFQMDSKDKYRGQKVQLLLKVPVGSKLFIDQSMKGFIYDVDNIQNIYDRDMINKNWEMTNKGLNCLDCSGTEDKIGEDSYIDFEKEDNHIRINNGGVYISGKDDNGEAAFVKIDSNGVQINSKGKGKHKK